MLAAMSTNQELEEKIAYLEKDLADLDAVVRELSAQLQIVVGQMKHVMSAAAPQEKDDGAPANDTPPHW